MLIGIACEDKGHFSAVTCLIDTALLLEHSWLNGILESCRTWRGCSESEQWYKYSPRDTNDLRPIDRGGIRIKPHGKIKGEPLKPEAGMWRRVLMLFCMSDPPPDAVVLARDMDGYNERQEGMKQARDGFTWPFAVVIAAAQPEIESWHVCGFVPEHSEERDALSELRGALSFDPTLESHRLTSHPNDAKTDAKRILQALCGHDEERRLRCLANHERLRSHGSTNGAASFLEDMKEHIIPVLGRDRG